MRISSLLRQAATYSITVTDALKGWLNLDKKTIYEATREVGRNGAFWHLTKLKKDVPDWAVHVIETKEELQKLKNKGYKQS
jgi:hypothetical protein